MKRMFSILLLTSFFYPFLVGCNTIHEANNYAKCITARPQKARSDVPVTYRIDWWSHQKSLEITDFQVEVVDAPLNLFNSKALVRMRIKGTFQGGENRRPFIEKTHISERIAESDSGRNHADFVVTPVVGLKDDKSYSGEAIPFDIKVENHFESLGWGENLYVVRCGPFTREVILTHWK